jgi:hypothetical protein
LIEYGLNKAAIFGDERRRDLERLTKDIIASPGARVFYWAGSRLAGSGDPT